MHGADRPSLRPARREIQLLGEYRTRLIAAFQAIVQSDEGVETVQMAYGWGGVELHDDSLFEPLRDLTRAVGAEMDSLL